MASVAEANSLFEIDMELDGLLEEIQEQVESQGEASEDLVMRFQQFCEAHGEKVDRIGRFVSMMGAREQFCRSEAARLTDRARIATGKVERTKNLVLYYLLSRDLKKIEGREFTLRVQRNSQDSVRITDEAAVPMSYCRIDVRIDGVTCETRSTAENSHRIYVGQFPSLCLGQQQHTENHQQISGHCKHGNGSSEWHPRTEVANQSWKQCAYASSQVIGKSLPGPT